MNCTILPLADTDAADRAFIVLNLTKPGSDFQKKLLDRRLDGTIALVREHGEIVGWARTEEWHDGSIPWDTLEAFVTPDYREFGVASFAAGGLVAFHDLSNVAVFHPHMLLVARRAGLRPILFHREGPAWLRV